MNKKFKKIGYRIGIVPIILALSIGLLAGGVTLAVEPLSASVEVTVDPALPNYLLNDGTGIEEIDWEITFDSTPREYTYEIFDPSDASVYGPITVNLPGTTPGEGSPVTDGYDWTVPAGADTGTYTVRVEYFSEDTWPDFEGASENTFRVKQAIEVRKFEDENGNGIKDVGEDEIVGTWNVQIWDPGMGSIYNGTMPAVIDVMGDGTFTATETPIAGWEVTTPSGSPSVTQTFVIPDLDEIVWFGNKELPQLGDLWIHKYEDFNGDGIDNDGLDLAGLTFNIFGPDDPGALYSTNMTDANGDIYLTGIPVGQYKVEEIVPPADPAWRCTDPGPGLFDMVNVVDTPTAYVDFGNQRLGDLLIYKYEDLDGSGTLNAGDIDGPGWNFTISGPSGPMNVGPTPVSGEILIEDIIPGSYSVKETTGPLAPPGWAWVCTDPPSGKTKTATVPSGGMDEVQFGNWLVERKVPTLGQWGIIGMSTVFAAMLVWFGVRRRRLAQMK